MLWLYVLPLWLDGAILLSLMVIAAETGFWVGRRRFSSFGREARRTLRSDVTLGSMLALLGLLLAFTYAFSLGRADMRKQAIVQEANAIGTAFLRADLGAEPGKHELRHALLDYARTRLVYQDLHGESVRAAVEHSLGVQSRLWPATQRSLGGDVPGPLQALIVQGVNDVIDAHAHRLAAINDRIPSAILGMLILITAASLSVAGHNAGLEGGINRPRMTMFSLVLTALILLIIDFDRSQAGLIRVDLQPMEALVQDLEARLRGE